MPVLQLDKSCLPSGGVTSHTASCPCRCDRVFSYRTLCHPGLRFFTEGCGIPSGRAPETSSTHPGRICGIKSTHSHWNGLTQRVTTAAEVPALQRDVVVADDTGLRIPEDLKG